MGMTFGIVDSARLGWKKGAFFLSSFFFLIKGWGDGRTGRGVGWGGGRTCRVVHVTSVDMTSVSI